MQVLEKILEEMREAAIKVSTVKDHTYFKAVGTRKIEEIIRSHMNDGKDEEVAKEVIDRILKFDCCNCPVKECDGEKDCDSILRDEILKIIKGSKGTDTTPTNSWIPCSERLPESYVDVLVDFGDDSPVIAYYCCMNNADIWRNSSTDKIIHIDVLAWQKLPEPYKLSEPKTMKNTQ